MKKLVFIIILLCLAGLSFVQAKTDTYSSYKVTGTAWNNTSQILLAEVPFGPIDILGLTRYRTKRLFSYAKLSLNTDAIPTGLGAFTATVPVTITYYLEGSTTPIVENKLLKVNYDPAVGAKFKNVAVEQIANAYKIEVSFNPIQLTPGTATAVHKNFISIQAFVEHERYYNYLSVFGLSLIMDVVVQNINKSYDPLNNELKLSWIPITHAEGYELEYTFIDDYGNAPGLYIPPHDLSFSFRHNSTRILLTENHYTLPLVQEHGYYIFRVRAWGVGGPDLDRIFYGAYDVTAGGTNPNQTFTVANFPFKYFVDNPEVHTGDKINWQSVTSFAEEGKSKTVVKYMDGTMRTRQTVTSTSTERNAIIAETIYDFQGRPAVNILPAPVNNAAIKYYLNFNQNLIGQPYRYTDFDLKGNNACDAFNIGPLNQQTSFNNKGAGNYYSQFNPNKTLFNAYIPEAKGYPLAVTGYMPDATERVVRQGSVGETFQPGNTSGSPYQGHDTKYYYGVPNQQELDRLFGTNVGYAQYYQKNLVTDPNGQVSVSYVNAGGKTIATALAGVAPTSLEPLKSLSSASTSIHVDLLSGSDIVDNENHSITNSKSFLVSSNKTDYTFTYSLQENTFNALACLEKTYCLDCIYDLEITIIRDECAKVEYSNKVTIGSLTDLNFKCNDANASEVLNFTVSLDIGSYTITKKLIVNKQAAEAYANNIINDPDNACLKSFNDFYEEAWNNRDVTRCMESCQACMEESQAAETAALVAEAVRSCDSLWCHPQIATLCDIARMSMINDLRPGGQYAKYMDGNGNIDLSISLISIFFWGGPGDIRTLYNTPSVQNIPITLPGQPTLPLSHYISDPSLLVQLINNWPDDLSEQLLPLHPEYCYLKFCDLPEVQSSNDFDTKYMNAETFSDAQTQGLINNINSFYTQDPLYHQYMPLMLQAEMVNKFNNYTGANNSIVQLAVFMANCPAGNNINNCPGSLGDGINDDDEWDRFKTIYFSLKQEFIQKAREYYVFNAGCCRNSYIGCANNNCPPATWHPLISASIEYPCFSNHLLPIFDFYQDASRRFITINDIKFEGMPTPTQSIYDMTAQELSTTIQPSGKNDLCPSCPEMDAFKLMLWYIMQKNWVSEGVVVNADEIAGLQGILRDRFLGSQNNEPITITRDKNTISISSKNCNITFNADTVVNWEKAEILPTCLEIKDYRNAKLHIMVDGAYKTTLSITSTCDLFYCEGKVADLPDTTIKPCIDPFIITFDTAAVFTSGLTIGAAPLQPNKYIIQNNYGAPFNFSFSSNVFLARTSPGNQLMIQKTATVANNQAYKVSFDGNLLKDPVDPDVFGIEVRVNNQLVYYNHDILVSGWQHYSFIWNSGGNTTVNVSISSFKQNHSDIFAIDNFKMECTNETVDTGRILRKEVKETVSKTSRYIPKNSCGHNSLCDANLPSPELPFIPCDSIQKELATQAATEAYVNYRDSVFNAILLGYYAKCMQSLETFAMDYKDAEYHYTLYYYDQSGNLVKTVPPAGVKPLSNTQLTAVQIARNTNAIVPVVPKHIMLTNYRHNSLNAVVWQKTPDAGITEFFYDKLGRIVLSQNANQKPALTASYTYYDELERTAEAGKINVAGVNLKLTAYNHIGWIPFINSRSRTEITHIYYDKSARTKINIAFGTQGQKYLRNRIGTVAYYANHTQMPAFSYQHATHYQYDIAGNVTELLQDFGTSSPFGQDPINVRSQSKHIAYKFDLVSGKVNALYYQQGYPDQFIYCYQYDADNRLTNVFTSANGTVWENDARYIYYRHGSQARTEFGTDKVQGADLAYTLQGWIKGVNGFANTAQTDIGKDGNQLPTGPANIGYYNQNAAVANDVYSYWLSYFKDDYQAIGNGTSTISNTTQALTTGIYHNDPLPLYNGNIQSMYTYLQPFGGLGMRYNYDQLNRIVQQTAYSFTGSNASLAANSAYAMSLGYDANGNIQKLLRNGNTNIPAMDDLNYVYYNTNLTTYTGDPATHIATNRLAFVKDAVSNANYTDDIDGQSANNYSYDAIGNLIKDTKEGISSIKWNLQNKIISIQKTNGIRIEYAYDAAGNRIMKYVRNINTGVILKKEYYVRDAQGNTLAVYDIKKAAIRWAEQHLYGSRRLGMYHPDVVLKRVGNMQVPDASLPVNLYSLSTWRNITQYELSNHLGNVLATISDVKTQSSGGNGVATIASAVDYYAFGAIMPGRNYNSTDYRYGYNTQEKTDEIAGAGNHYTAPYWEYDPRAVLRWNTDPKLHPSFSPYAINQCNPIWFSDPLGDSIRTPKNLFDDSPVGPYQKGYSQNGLNLQDWETFREGIKDVSGISLATPSRDDKNLQIASIDESIGSADARTEFKGLLNQKKMHQQVTITNNDPGVLGAENNTSYIFDAKTGNLLGTDYNAGVMNIDLADFRQWQKTNTGITGTTDTRAFGVGFSFLHENLHNRGVGTFGLTQTTIKTADIETPVINQTNIMNQQMRLPTRLSHSRSYDNTGGYIPFSDGSKFYIK